MAVTAVVPGGSHGPAATRSTGSGRGIGRAITLGLADAGGHVILLARTAGQLEETRAASAGWAALPTTAALADQHGGQAVEGGHGIPERPQVVIQPDGSPR